MKIIIFFLVLFWLWIFFYRIEKFFPWKIFSKKLVIKWNIFTIITLMMYLPFYIPYNRKLLNLVIGILLFSMIGIFNLAFVAKKMSIQSAEYFKNEDDIEKATKFNNLAKKINYKIKEGFIIIIIGIILVIIKTFF